MLKVKTFIAKSKIPGAGLGCFAGQDIKAGADIWELVESFDRVYTTVQYSRLPAIAQKFINHFGYYNPNEGGWILCSDNGKYFNHSQTPNCIARGLVTIATEDIKFGEEITEDYYTFDEKASQKLS